MELGVQVVSESRRPESQALLLTGLRSNLGLLWDWFGILFMVGILALLFLWTSTKDFLHLF